MGAQLLQLKRLNLLLLQHHLLKWKASSDKWSKKAADEFTETGKKKAKATFRK
jgi:hypothetical protein